MIALVYSARELSMPLIAAECQRDGVHGATIKMLATDSSSVYQRLFLRPPVKSICVYSLLSTLNGAVDLQRHFNFSLRACRFCCWRRSCSALSSCSTLSCPWSGSCSTTTNVVDPSAPFFPLPSIRFKKCFILVLLR